jgi:hypothetical protein
MGDGALVVDEDRSRFEMAVDGHTAFITFRRSDGTITLVHTEVPEELGGRGVGTKLVAEALAYVRDNGLSLVAECPFVRRYLKRHPDEATSFGIDTSKW